ncbi:hypothetical protein NX059_006395 [Plenodomus lindquistii]|nr:hypothetical protein NX059_006395 [Plenodomus lindquistii]
MFSIKALSLFVLASFALAAPQGNGGNAQDAKVAELEAEGLSCAPGPQGTVNCQDGTGATM